MNIYTTQQASDLLGIPRQRVIQHIQRKILPAFKWGHQYAITGKDLLAHGSLLATGEISKKGPKQKAKVFNTCTTVSPQFDIAVVLGKSEPMQLVIDNPTE